MAIRKATIDDSAAVGRMWGELARHQASVDSRFELSTDYMKRWKADFDPWVRSTVHGLFIATADDATPCGFVHVRAHEVSPIFTGPPEAMIEAVWTDPGHRRRGVAKSLFDAASGWAREYGAARVRFAVAVSDTVAVAFWERMGGSPLLAYGTIDIGS